MKQIFHHFYPFMESKRDDDQGLSNKISSSTRFSYDIEKLLKMISYISVLLKDRGIKVF